MFGQTVVYLATPALLHEIREPGWYWYWNIQEGTPDFDLYDQGPDKCWMPFETASEAEADSMVHLNAVLHAYGIHTWL